MSLALDLRPPPLKTALIERAVLATLAYSDVFDFPLQLEELHRFLTLPMSFEELSASMELIDRVETQDGYYFLAGRSDIVALRKRRELASRRPFERALRYGRLLGTLPFVRMVALTGSLAVRNCDETADYDYMLVAKSGRVWLARAFALALNRFAHLFGESLCPNLIISEQALEWSPRNLYTAREICQMDPISGMGVYFDLRVANSWTREYLPNFPLKTEVSPPGGIETQVHARQRYLEFFLPASLGDRLESWEMNRKVARFTRQEGFGIETRFTPDICQGNFDHHGSWALEKYHVRLSEIGIVSPLSKRENGWR